MFVGNGTVGVVDLMILNECLGHGGVRAGAVTPDILAHAQDGRVQGVLVEAAPSWVARSTGTSSGLDSSVFRPAAILAHLDDLRVETSNDRHQVSLPTHDFMDVFVHVRNLVSAG